MELGSIDVPSTTTGCTKNTPTRINAAMMRMMSRISRRLSVSRPWRDSRAGDDLDIRVVVHGNAVEPGLVFSLQIKHN